MAVGSMFEFNDFYLIEILNVYQYILLYKIFTVWYNVSIFASVWE